MSIEISVESQSVLNEYAMVPMVFESDLVLEVIVVEGGLGGFNLRERRLNKPFVKDAELVAIHRFAYPQLLFAPEQPLYPKSRM